MRIGIFGGTFDPVHYGHLLLAETCREQCALDQVWLLPASVPPHKQERTLTPANRRTEMLELAIAGHEAFIVSSLEIERGGVSYTVDTLSTVRQGQPDAELFFLMGADSLHDLPTWRETQRICQLATPVVVRRRGAPEPDFNVLNGIVADERLVEIRRHQVEMPVVDFSSTAIRQAVAAGRSIRYQTPRAIEKYIETHGLYGESGSAKETSSPE
jgi:nicotinate-nucleotide adenylyltransferase